jgi:Protein of unknown function (DUF1566)
MLGLLKNMDWIRNYSALVLLFSLLSFFSALASQRFVENENGTITDTETGLMWVSKDNGAPINWPDAKKYCENLNVAGYSDWRIPTLAELATLYTPHEKNKNGYHTIALVDTTAQSCWSSERKGNLAGRFNFTYGEIYWIRQMYSGPTRVLAVRMR